MQKFVMAVALMVIMGLMFGACGSDPYCDAVESQQDSLDTFGNDKTNEAFADDAQTLRQIAKVAPNDVAEAWETLAMRTQAVVDTHKDLGLSLEDSASKKKLSKLAPEELEELNKVRSEFNETDQERAEIITSVKDHCDIELHE